MKLSRSTALRLTAAVLAFVLAAPAGAFAALEDPPSGTSMTNPNVGDAAWREGWGNSLWPNVTITAIPADPGEETLGFLYDMSRIVKEPGIGDPIADISWDPSGPMLVHTFDLQTIYNGLPSAERVYVPQPGQVLHHPMEGIWKLNMRYYNGSRLSTRTWTFDLGIDVTPPRPIAGFTALEPNVASHGRRTYRWRHLPYDGLPYDDLSGVAWYELFVNGKLERTLPIVDWLPAAATIETLPPGINTVGIRVMDKATNVSPMVTRTEIVDPDVPATSIAYPASGQYLAGWQTFSVKATDAACSPRVVIKIDGRVWRDLRRGPYDMRIDTNWLSNGYHTMSVTARDLAGHTSTVNRGFYVDNRKIRMTSVSDSPDPFYPVKVDGIKDRATIRCSMDEGATDLFLKIFDSDTTTLVRQYHWTRVGAGTFSMTWDGKNASGALAFGDGLRTPLTKTAYYQFHARDRAGNWTISGKYPVTYRNYEVVPTGTGSVRIVWR